MNLDRPLAHDIFCEALVHVHEVGRLEADALGTHDPHVVLAGSDEMAVGHHQIPLLDVTRQRRLTGIELDRQHVVLAGGLLYEALALAWQAQHADDPS